MRHNIPLGQCVTKTAHSSSKNKSGTATCASQISKTNGRNFCKMLFLIRVVKKNARLSRQMADYSAEVSLTEKRGESLHFITSFIRDNNCVPSASAQNRSAVSTLLTVSQCRVDDTFQDYRVKQKLTSNILLANFAFIKQYVHQRYV